MRCRRTLVLLLPVVALVGALAACSSGGATPTPTVTRTVTASPTTTADAPTTDAPTASSAPTPGSSATASACGTADAATATAAAVADLPTPPGLSSARWDASRATTALYDPCAALSSVVVPIEDATASSPYAILLFHDGRYLGTATKEQYGFFPQTSRTSDATIAVRYTYPEAGEPDATASGRSDATFSWDASTDRVVMRGDVPPEG